MPFAIRSLVLAGLVWLGGAASAVQAAALQQTFRNDFETNVIYLWLTDTPNDVDFLDVTFGKAATDWYAFVDEPNRLFLTGPTIAPSAGRFRVTFSENTAFSFEWAEGLLDDGVLTVQGTGTLSWGTGGWTASETFTQPASQMITAVPLPGSKWLLGTGVLGLVGLSRARRD